MESRIKLPPWPHMTVLKPHRVGKMLKKVKWPRNTLNYAEFLAQEMPDVSASVNLAPAICKSFDVSEEDLRAALALIEDARF